MATVDADNRYYISNITALCIHESTACMKRKRDMQSLQMYIFFSFASAERNPGLRYYHALNCQSDLISDLLKVTGRNRSSLR